MSLPERNRSLYILGFTSGTVKVGRAVDLSGRLAEHKRLAAVHGIQVARTWTSEPHRNFIETEQALIAFCGRNLLIEGREYFLDADFDVIAEFAASLPYDLGVGPKDENAAVEARAARTRQLDAFEAAAKRYSDRPGAEWPSGLLGLARMGFAPLPKDFVGGES
jgi:hypothetical protein